MALTKVITGVTDLNQAQSTNGLKFPTGNVFAGTPEEGMIRNDQSQASEGSASTMQFYNGTAWKNFVNVVPIISVNYLVSGGGGGGASGFGGIGGGGGGAGGIRSSYGNIAGTPSWANDTTLSLVPGTNYTVTVGGGGVGATSGEGTIGTNGSDSVFNTITSIGGGGANNNAGAGGSSGVVILRYPSSYTITVPGALTATTATVGTDKVTTFTAGTGTITFS